MSKRITFSLVAAYLGAAMVAGIATASGEAQAWWTRTAATDCVEVIGNDTSTFNPGCNDSTANTKLLACTVPDSSATPKSSIAQFNVHIEEWSSSLAGATRCVQFRDSVGGSCGSMAVKSGNGLAAVSPSTFSGWTTTNYGYVMVQLPPSPSSGSSNQSCLKGFLTAN